MEMWPEGIKLWKCGLKVSTPMEMWPEGINTDGVINRKIPQSMDGKRGPKVSRNKSLKVRLPNEEIFQLCN